MTDGKVKAGVFAQTSLSKNEHALMEKSLSGSYVSLVPVETKKSAKKSDK